jgi:hypothetical protein
MTLNLFLFKNLFSKEREKEKKSKKEKKLLNFSNCNLNEVSGVIMETFMNDYFHALSNIYKNFIVYYPISLILADLIL